MHSRVLFVDDEPSIRGIYEMLGHFLGERYLIATAEGPEEARRLMAELAADVVVSDLVMPGASGAELLQEIARLYPSCARIAVSGYADQVTMAKCLTVAHRYFTKPFNPIGLTQAIEELQTGGTQAAGPMRKMLGAIHSLPVSSEN